MDKFLCVFHRNKIVQILYIIFFCKTNLCVGYIDTQVESQNEKEKGTPGPESSAGIVFLVQSSCGLHFCQRFRSCHQFKCSHF